MRRSCWLEWTPGSTPFSRSDELACAAWAWRGLREHGAWHRDVVHGRYGPWQRLQQTTCPCCTQCAMILGQLWLAGDTGVRRRVLMLLHQKGATLAEVRELLLEYRANLGDAGERILGRQG